MDFKNLLHKLASGDDGGVADTVLERRKNGPPTMQSTPAQSALQDVAVGAGMMPDKNLTTTNTPSVTQPVENQPLVAAPDQPSNEEPVVQPFGLFAPNAGAGVGTTRPPSMEGLPLDEAATEGQARYVDAVNAPIVKQSLWKDIGAKLIGASNAFVKGYRGDPNIEPSYGWGKIKHDNAVNRAAQTLAPLQQQQGVNRQAAAQNANIDIAKIRPDIMQQDANTKAARVAGLDAARKEAISFKNRTQDWKEEDRKQWYDLQREKQDAINENNENKRDLAQQRQDELEQQNQVKNDQKDRSLGQGDTRIQATADKAKAHMQSLPEADRQKKIEDLVKIYMKNHKKATAEDITNARNKLNETYNKPLKAEISGTTNQ